MSHLFQRGDIILIRFPFTDLSGSKRRPAIVLAEYSQDIIVAFISSVIPNTLEPTDILLQPSSPFFSSTGLKKASIIRLRKIATLEQNLITRRLGILDKKLITKVDEALLNGLEIDVSNITKAEYQKLASLLQEQGGSAVLTYIQSKAYNGN